MKRTVVALLSFLVMPVMSAPLLAQDVSPADITFWQSIKDSEDPEEFRAYLESFPDGAFAELAQLRIDRLSAGGTGKRKGGGEAEPDVEDEVEDEAGGDTPEDLSEAELTITPETIRVGDTIKVNFQNMPKPSTSDIVVIVPAGSPDSMGATTNEGVLTYVYISNEYYLTNGWEVGPFAPGAYEARWLTRLYNNVERLEVGARTEFEVNR